jgi:hypothetical protein
MILDDRRRRPLSSQPMPSDAARQRVLRRSPESTLDVVSLLGGKDMSSGSGRRLPRPPKRIDAASAALPECGFCVGWGSLDCATCYAIGRVSLDKWRRLRRYEVINQAAPGSYEDGNVECPDCSGVGWLLCPICGNTGRSARTSFA